MSEITIRNTSDDRELVRRTVAQSATDAELDLFFYDCARRGVHPLDKLIHFTKRGGKYVPVTSIDFLRSRAAASDQFAGSDDAVFVDGKNGGAPTSASVTVYRLTQGQRFPYTGTARWSEYNPGGGLWQKMPHTMLAKCAEALALRKAFPQELAGLYEGAELAQAERAAPARENPHVTRREDLEDEQAPEGWRFKNCGDPAKSLKKTDPKQREYGTQLQQEAYLIQTAQQAREWFLSDAVQDRTEVMRQDWLDQLSDRLWNKVFKGLISDEAEAADPESESEQLGA